MSNSSFYPDSRSPAAGLHFENELDYDATVQEAERLLAQFTQCSRPKGQSGPVTHGHTMFMPGPTHDGWQTKRTIQIIPPRKTSTNPLPPNHRITSTHSSPAPSPPQPKEPNRQASLRKNATLSNANKNRVDRRTQSPESTGQTVSVSASTSTLTSTSTSRKNPRESSAMPVRTQLRISPSVYKSSPSSSRSPEPHASMTTTRRSGRPRKDPVTYNLRTLSGLDKDGLEKDLVVIAGASEEDSTTHVSHTMSIVSDLSSAPVQTESGPLHTATDVRKLLQSREIHGKKPHSQIRAAASSNLKVWKSWKGASNDVNTLTWSPEGTRFAAGATTHSDEYNRGNNLVLGDLVHNSLDELPDHWTPRPASVSATDTRLFSSVVAVQWVGDRLCSASYDRTVKIWDVQASPRASCIRTLTHETNVVVMALSNWMPDLVATGAQEFELWNLGTDQEPTPVRLDIQRSSLQKTNINLTPTTLTWGQNAATRRFLVGGMAGPSQDHFSVSLYGHLGLWKVEESEITSRKLSPDSQNIFDIKWHPSMSRFVTASTPGLSSSMKLPRGYRSVVRIYEYEVTGDKFTATTEFPCPALDINEVTFCPMSTAYVTASCTDGSTYVWDNRNPGRILHKLQHGSSSTPLRHDYDREISDFGVKVALWGGSMDQLYTGGSDCCLKQWDIRRSPEDALVANTAKFGHDIVSGAFSEDKSHLLIGDYGGGIHVLSSGPCADPDVTDFEFNYAPEPEPPSNGEDGITLAKDLLTSGQLTMHRKYGAVQGPNYMGPFARWARNLPESTPLRKVSEVPLLDEYQLRQFDGPKVKHRKGLDDQARRDVRRHIALAKIRNSRNTRCVAVSSPKEVRIKHERDLSIDNNGSTATRRSTSVPHGHKRRKIESGQCSRVITNTNPVDLTQDSGSENGPNDLECLEAFDLDRPDKLSENLDDDYYYPDSGSVDPNFD